MNTATAVILAIPMEEDDAKAATIGEYLVALLVRLWEEEAGFSGKRPFGNSGWQWDVYKALAKAGAVSGMVFDEDGYIDEFPKEQERLADAIILACIKDILP